MKFPHQVIVQWSDEDEVYIARVPAFSLLAAHGNTVGGAADEAVAAAYLMMESLEERIGIVS